MAIMHGRSWPEAWTDKARSNGGTGWSIAKTQINQESPCTLGKEGLKCRSGGWCGTTSTTGFGRGGGSFGFFLQGFFGRGRGWFLTLFFEDSCHVFFSFAFFFFLGCGFVLIVTFGLKRGRERKGVLQRERSEMGTRSMGYISQKKTKIGLLPRRPFESSVPTLHCTNATIKHSNVSSCLFSILPCFKGSNHHINDPSAINTCMCLLRNVNHAYPQPIH